MSRVKLSGLQNVPPFAVFTTWQATFRRARAHLTGSLIPCRRLEQLFYDVFDNPRAYRSDSIQALFTSGSTAAWTVERF
jgi:hypothetical protein